MKTLTYLLSLTGIIIIAGCSDNPVNPRPIKVEVSGLVTAYYCYGDGTTMNYVLTTGKQGYVALARADGLAYLSVTDRSSHISLSVDTGLYNVVVTTFHMAPDTIFQLHILHDTSGIEFWSRLDYSPADSLVMRIEYFPGDSVFTDPEEQNAIGYMVHNLPDSLNFAPAWRSVSYLEPGHCIVSYLDIAVLGNQPSWRAVRDAYALLASHPEKFPKHMTVSEYGHACWAGNLGKEQSIR